MHVRSHSKARAEHIRRRQYETKEIKFEGGDREEKRIKKKKSTRRAQNKMKRYNEHEIKLVRESTTHRSRFAASLPDTSMLYHSQFLLSLPPSIPSQLSPLLLFYISYPDLTSRSSACRKISALHSIKVEGNLISSSMCGHHAARDEFALYSTWLGHRVSIRSPRRVLRPQEVHRQKE